jgi:hypothetical protein
MVAMKDRKGTTKAGGSGHDHSRTSSSTKFNKGGVNIIIILVAFVLLEASRVGAATAPLEAIPPEEPGYKKPAYYFSDSYPRRAQPDRKHSSDQALKKAWGSWTLQDDKARPNLDKLFEKHTNKDLPRSEFPANAWQVDADYLKKYLQESIALTERALGAILAEYGHFDIGKDNLDAAMADADATQPAFMFNLTIWPIGSQPHKKARSLGNAGYTNSVVLENLRRLLLHSIMTQDTFHVTMGGHSSAAGHGNSFPQSYTPQIQRALEPLLARLGVFHISRNMGMGGLGTLHNALAAQSIYGGDSDILIWDSSMYVRL